MGNGQFDSMKIEHLLGPPDRIVRQGHRLYDMIVNMRANDPGTAAPKKIPCLFLAQDSRFFILHTSIRDHHRFSLVACG